MVTKRGKRKKEIHRGSHKENTSAKPSTSKMRRVDFCICNYQGLKTTVLEVHGMAGGP